MMDGDILKVAKQIAFSHVDSWGEYALAQDIAAAILAERQRCANAVLAEKLIDPTSHSDDIAYDTAIDHAHDAIWRIEP